MGKVTKTIKTAIKMYAHVCLNKINNMGENTITEPNIPNPNIFKIVRYNFIIYIHHQLSSFSSSSGIGHSSLILIIPIILNTIKY
jgi:hypothetical protein